MKPKPLQIEQHLGPILRTFARTIGKADEFLATVRHRADPHQNALLLVFDLRLQVDGIGPDLNVTFRR
jgi:hypothetical protein